MIYYQYELTDIKFSFLALITSDCQPKYAGKIKKFFFYRVELVSYFLTPSKWKEKSILYHYPNIKDAFNIAKSLVTHWF